jgi:hypothetical protein
MFQISMIQTWTVVVDYIHWELRQYIDDTVLRRRIFRVVISISQFDTHYEWAETGYWQL